MSKWNLSDGSVVVVVPIDSSASFYEIVLAGPPLTTSGNRLEHFRDKTAAKITAESFTQKVQLAIDKGYHIAGSFLRNDITDKEVHLNNALDNDRSVEDFSALLDAGEIIHPFRQTN